MEENKKVFDAKIEVFEKEVKNPKFKPMQNPLEDDNYEREFFKETIIKIEVKTTNDFNLYNGLSQVLKRHF